MSATAAPGPTIVKSPHRRVNPWLVLVIACLAQFMVVLDATVVNIALPSVQRGLHFSAANLQWVVNAYTLIFGGFLLLGGRAADLLGRKRLFVAGVILFSAASLLNGFGSPETTTGGKALKFYASVRLDIRRIETLKDGSDALGNRTRVKVVKNKCAPPFKQAEFDILYGHGISKEGSLIDLGVEQGVVRKSGAWYTYEGDQLGQGKENARKFLADNPDIAAEIDKRIKDKLGIGAKLDADQTVPAPVDF
jgi:hypothetical protein